MASPPRTLRAPSYRGLSACAIALFTLLPATAGPYSQAPTSPIPIRGISYFSFRESTFADNTQQPVLDYIEASGANWVQLATMHFWDPSVRAIVDRRGTTDIHALPVAITRVRQRRLKTALYVFVRTNDNESFYSTAPSDTNEFFRHFGNLVLGYADIAQREGVDLLVLGNEMNSLTGPAYRERWVEIIDQVRQRFKGRISYGAIPNYFLRPATIGDVTDVVSFWDKLDLIGFSVYPQLATSPRPDRSEVERGWTRSLYTSSNILRNLRRWYELTNKPVLFTEIGYKSADGAAINPGQPLGNAGAPNNDLQALLYDVMFSQVDAESGLWLEGLFLWTLNTWNKQNDPFLQQIYVDLDFTFFRKPAGDVVARWLSAWRVSESAAKRGR